LDEVVELCRGSDLIGISFMTHFFDRARQLTEHLKKNLKAPIIWGGIHPTVRPEESLDYADLVLVGEGEEAFLELVDNLAAGKDIQHLENIWMKKGQEIIKNPLRPLIQDLDRLPAFDFSLEEHYLYATWLSASSLLTRNPEAHFREPAFGTFLIPLSAPSPIRP
jgi:radical SAM superfamily enzyme YgiQ (UPF0313 family)